jgi:aquaporin Z
MAAEPPIEDPTYSAPDANGTAAPHLVARLAAEAFGTFLLVFGLIGTALFDANFPDAANPLGVGFLGVALAVGLTVIAGAYMLGAISGAHFNPAVSLGLAAAGRLSWRDVPAYVGAQLVGAVVATSAIYVISAGGKPEFLATAVKGGFASNGYGNNPGGFGSPGGFGLSSAILAELILTAVFLYVIIGVTSKRAAAGFAPLAIGLTLTLIHLVSIPIDNTSVNPARSIATAIYGGPDALGQLWVFIVAPIVGALFAGFTFRYLFDKTVRA